MNNIFLFLAVANSTSLLAVDRYCIVLDSLINLCSSDVSLVMNHIIKLQKNYVCLCQMFDEYLFNHFV